MFQRAMSQMALLIAAMGALLFVPTGDWGWVEAWAFLAMIAINAAAMCAWLARRDPGLLEARLSGPTSEDQAPWDKLFMLVLMGAFMAWLAVMGLDARRFSWSHVPGRVEILGAVLTQICFLLVWPVFAANSFPAPQVRLQAERSQAVVSRGPYRVVRHPMYAAAIFFFIGVPLQLGSWVGLACAPLFIVALGVRAIGEERMLMRQLDGYEAYANRVRFRFVPGLW
jgi:protein-S-isoprenylcysteine O-methyltransferase Ste14